MRTGKQFKDLGTNWAISSLYRLSILVALGFAICPANATTYTDVLGDGQGSANLLRDLSSASITNDASNLYITINLNPGANIATGGSFNYVIGITSGSGGDTSANATTHGNPYGRSISFDSSLGGMTDFIGVFGAGGSGTAGSPFTSYGFNDYAWNTNGVSQTWSKINQVSSGMPISGTPPSSISLTIPMSDFASNLSLTPGTTFYFDIFSTGTSGNQTAYDSLVVQGPIQGTFSATAQYNATALYSYTIAAVPEPSSLALVSLAGIAMLLRHKRHE